MGLPVIDAASVQADYRTGADWVRGGWNISPSIAFDSLPVSCHAARETFGFYTDRDSIVFKLAAGECHNFYVRLNDTAYAMTVVQGVKPAYTALRFDAKTKNKDFRYWYEANQGNKFLDELRAKYPVDSLVKNAGTDMERALRIVNWVHRQWPHNGENQPRESNAISILEEAREGKNFRCVEYGIVATACLNAVGLKARVLGLKSQDVETRQYGAGHVLLEVYLNDLQKWAVADGQWDAVPVLEGRPLNAVEFQRAIANDYAKLEIRSLSGTSKRHYIDWIYPYLYYFDVPFDNREGHGNRRDVQGKYELMLVPAGAKEPKIFQREYPINDCLYTHSLADFYAPPE
jgi:hypothetical protein